MEIKRSDSDPKPTKPPNEMPATPFRLLSTRQRSVSGSINTFSLASLIILAKRADDHDEETENYNETSENVKSDEESQSISTIFDGFIERGWIKEMISTTNISRRVFNAIWDHISDFCRLTGASGGVTVQATK